MKLRKFPVPVFFVFCLVFNKIKLIMKHFDSLIKTAFISLKRKITILQNKAYLKNQFTFVGNGPSSNKLI
jgi:hypothetical protein